MKRILGVALAAILAFNLCACGKQTTEEPGKQTKAEEKVDFSMYKFPKDKLKFGVIHIGNPADGSGYTFAHDEGIIAMQKAIGLKDDQIVRKNNIPDTDPSATETAIRDCIEEGCNVIVGTSWGYMDTMESLAQEFPKVIFTHCSGYKNNGRNMNNYFGRIYQARYLTGIAAGLKTKTNKIGFVAAMNQENSEVTGAVDSFALGVKSVNPKAKVYVKVTNTWFSPELEANAAKALIAEGCDVIAQHCNTPNPQLEAEKAGVWGCGYDSDMTKDAPKAHLTAPVWHWGAYYTELAKELIEGRWTCQNYYGGLKEGMVGISPLSQNCAPGTKEKIEEAEKKMLDGSFNVFDGVIKLNDGKTVGTEGKTLSDDDIKGNIHWYVENVIVK